MTPKEIMDYCLSKNGAYLEYPFGPDVAVVKVGKPEIRPGRIFAQFFVLRGKETVTLNCDEMTGQLYRQLYPNIVVRGYHCPPVQQPYFNTFALNGAVPDEMLVEMVEHSYEVVVRKLPKYIQKALERAD